MRKVSGFFGGWAGVSEAARQCLRNFRVLRRLEGWGLGGCKAVSAQGFRVLWRLEGWSFLRPQGCECARLQGSSEVGRLGSLRLQGSECARFQGSLEVGRRGFLRPQGSECARLQGSSEVGRQGFLRPQGCECGTECGVSVELFCKPKALGFGALWRLEGSFLRLQSSECEVFWGTLCGVAVVCRGAAALPANPAPKKR